MIAYCWASGEIEFGDILPAGAIELARGGKRKVRKEIEVTARRGYDGKLLVPGIPEAASQSQGVDALQLHLLWLKQREERGFVVAITPDDPFLIDLSGVTVGHLDADGRIRMVASFDTTECMEAYLVPGLQKGVRKAIDQRLRQLLRERHQ